MNFRSAKIAMRGTGIILILVLVVFLANLAQVDTGITFATSGVDLKIDSKAWYNGVVVPAATWAMKNLVPGSDKFWNFSDIKPGDYGCNVVSIHVQNTNAWACMDFNNLQQSENGQTEPEKIVDNSSGSTTGELAAETEFFGWTETDGDGKFEPPSEKPIFGTSTKSATNVLNNKTYAIADANSGNSCQQNTTRYVGMCWCAGKLSVDLKTGKQSCDGSKMGNESQTDSWTVDVAIRAMKQGDDPKFMCKADAKDPKKDPKGNNGVGNGEDPPPPGGGNSGNDGPGTGPGNPGGSGTAPGGSGKPTFPSFQSVADQFNKIVTKSKKP
jgi:hypothetical protein